MTQYITAFLISLPIFMAIDLTWLGLIAKDFYRTRLNDLLADSFNWPVAVLFYVVFLIGLLIFAIAPALDARSVMRAAIWGALFGFFTYATYDLTNLATLKNWSLSLTIVDILWGTVLGAAVAAASTALTLTVLKV